MLESYLKAGSIKLQVPFVDTRTRNANSGKFAESYPITKGEDQYLVYAVTGFYNSNDTANTTYDHSNFNGVKVTKIRTKLKEYTTDNQIGCLNANYFSVDEDIQKSLTQLQAYTNLTVGELLEDYREMRKNTFGRPVCCNQITYQNNWFYMDSWGLPVTNQEIQQNIPEENYIAGLYLKGSDYLYTVEADTPLINIGTPAATNPYANYNSGKQLVSYTFLVFNKTLYIKPTKTFFDSENIMQ
jgi:hypothetical protein